MYAQTYLLSQLSKMLILLISSYCKMCTLPTLLDYDLACLSVANNTNTRDCIVGNGHILQWDEQNQHFAELRQKNCLYIHVVVLLTCLPSLDGKLERFVTKKVPSDCQTRVKQTIDILQHICVCTLPGQVVLKSSSPQVKKFSGYLVLIEHSSSSSIQGGQTYRIIEASFKRYK